MENNYTNRVLSYSVPKSFVIILFLKIYKVLISYFFQLSDAPADDKSKKKKRLDDLLSGLHAGKGNSLPEKKDSPMDNLMKKSAESSRTDLNKLQEMLGPLGGNPGDAKVRLFNFRINPINETYYFILLIKLIIIWLVSI